MSIEQILITPEVQESLIHLHKKHYELMNQQWNFRDAMRMIDLAYLREQDMTVEQWRAKIENKLGNSDKIQNVTVPIIKPQVVSAVAYQTAVFLSQYPLFEINAAPNMQNAAKQMQALIEENSIRGGWVRQFILFFFDANKYNLSAIECSWDRKVTAAIETDVAYSATEGKPTKLIWSGNVAKRWDLYNTYWDTRCLPAEIAEFGDFCGHTEVKTRIALHNFLKSLVNPLKDNFQKAFESPSFLNVPSSASGVEGFFIPALNPEVLIDYSLIDQDNWDSWAGIIQSTKNMVNPGNYKGLYELSTEYIRIIPNEHGLNKVPAADCVQIWKLWIVNHSVIVAAERQTNAHEKIPVFFGSPNDDGLGYQSKSLASDSTPFQQVASAIMNGVLAGRRRSVTDRVLYDPSRISEAQINSPNPSAKIPVRPAAFGTDLSKSVYQFPYREDQAAQGLQEINTVVQLSNVLVGQNQARQGQFVKGNKTDGQWESTMSNATSADQLSAYCLEVQVFTPFKEVLKLNYLQYQAGTEIYSSQKKENVKIDPVVLRKAIIEFKATDGLTPKEKVMSTDARKIALQTLGTSQILARGYNIAPLFTYIMKTENVDLSSFEKSPAQVAYEDAVNNWTILAQTAIQQGKPFSSPQPTPQQYGFDPNMTDPANQTPEDNPSIISD
jgi:hypothetical protein